MSVVIDSHQHFWDRSLSQFDHSWQETPHLKKICRDFLPADLKPLLDQANVNKSVFVQTQHNVEENRWVLSLVDDNEWIAGVVGWVDLAGDDCEAQIEEFKVQPKFVGVRHVVQDEPDDDFIIRDDVMRGLGLLEKHGVPYDLLFYAKHLKHAPVVAGAYPELKLVIDHLSKPNIKEKQFDDWKKELQEAAKFSNVFCKLSGMITEADWENWKPEDLKPYVETALEAFGPERCMYGSDWPVCELAGTYQEAFDALSSCIGGLSDSERSHVMGDTAAKFYGLDV